VGLPKSLAETSTHKQKNSVYHKAVSSRRKSNPEKLDRESDF